MRKRFLSVIIYLFIFGALYAQSENISLLGRWGRGPSQAVFKRGNFVFVGSGAYLQAYQNRLGVYDIRDEILLPGNIEDIWVNSDTTHIYVACGNEGLQVVYFNHNIRQFAKIIGSYDTPGYASGLMHYGSHVYLADGEQGLTIFDVSIPSAPVQKGTYKTDGYAYDVWVKNNSSAFVATGSGGLLSINIQNVSTPYYQDKITFPTIGDNPAPEVYNVITIADTAYVAAGYGGLRFVNVANPTSIAGKEINYWTNGSTGIDIRDLWISDGYAYLVCGDYGILTNINVKSVENILDFAPWPAFTNDGYPNAVVVDQDTAYVAYGSGGHLVVNVPKDDGPTLISSFAGSDKIYGVELDDNYLYAATGANGVNIFSLDIDDPPEESLTPDATYDTDGEVRGLKISGTRLFIADGTGGLKALNIANPLAPVLEKTVDIEGDTCFNIAVSSQYVFAACGTGGIRVYQYTSNYSEHSASPVDIGSPVYNLTFKDNRLYAATNAGVKVFNFASQVNFQNVLNELETDVPVNAVDAMGDTVFAANGSNGMIMWDLISNETKTIDTGGSCADLLLTEKNVFAALSDSGIAIYDYNSQEDVVKVAYYESKGDAQRIQISPDTKYIGVADQVNGLHILSNEIRPLISIDPTDINFGPVPISYSRTLIITVSNPGTAELEVSSFEIAGNSNAFSYGATSFTVPPGGEYNLAVTFSPKAGDDLTHTTVVDIYSNSDVVRLTLNGKSSVLVNDGPYDVDDDVFTAGLWHFNENDEAVSAADASEHGLTGTLKGGATRGASKDGFSRALVLNGSNAWVEIPKTSYLNFSDSPFSAECFFSLSAEPQGTYVLIARGTGNTLQYEMGIGEDTERGIKGLYAWINDENGNAHIISYDLLRDIQLNYWYHAAMTWDKKSLKLYLNGSVVVEDAFSGTLKDEDVVTTIGSDPIGTKPFKGMIDEVRISSINREYWEYHVNRSKMTVNADTLNFGKVPLGRSRTLTFTIQNDGSQQLTVSSITPPNSQVLVSSDNFTLETGTQKAISVTFQPTETVSMKSGNYLTITSTDPTFPTKTIVIQGQGLSKIDPGAYSATDDPFNIGLWHFDEWIEPTNEVVDESDYHNNGYLNGGATCSASTYKFGKALRCDGSNNMFWIPIKNAPEAGEYWDGFTFEGWFYPMGLPTEEETALLVRRGSSANYQFQVTLEGDDKLHAKIRDSAQEIYSIDYTTDTIKVETWYHFALRISGDSLSFILNGISSAKKAISEDFFANTAFEDSSICIGNDYTRTQGFNGFIDEVRMSNIGRETWEFNVIDARLEISEKDLDFGEVLQGYTSNRTINLINNGSDSLQIDNIISSNPSLFQLPVISFPLMIPPGGMVNLNITFSPSEVGQQITTITIYSNDPFWPDQKITATGTGTEQISSGEYTIDDQTLSLFHFSDTDNIDFGVRPVAWSDSGRFGQALRIKKGGWVNIPMSSDLSLSSSAGTFEFWFLMREIPTAGGNAALFRWGDKESNWIYMYFHNEEGVGEINTVFGNSQAVSVPVPDFHLYQWYHLALTWDGEDTLRFYLNNELKIFKSLKSSGIKPLPITLSAAKPFLMGASDSTASNPFVGSFDEFRLSKIQREQWEFNVLTPKIYVNPSSLYFSEVLNGQSRTLTFNVKNQGDQDLTIGNMAISETAFSISPSAGFTLPRLKSKTISITFQPTISDTSYENNLFLTTNDPTASTKAIVLMGQSVKARTFSAFDNDDPNTVLLYHFDASDLDTTSDYQIILNDKSGNGKTGYVQGALLKKDGLFDTEALYFDGKNDYVIINSNQDLIFDMLTESFSIEFSFMTDTLAGQQTFVSKGVRDTVFYQVAMDRYGHVIIPGFGTTTQYFNDGKWHQLAFLYYPTDTTFLYIDGERVLWKKLFKFSNNDKGRPLLIGAAENTPNNQAYFLNGAIDEFRISSVLRSSWEIAQPEYDITVQLTPTLAVYNQDLTIKIQVPDAIDILSAMVYYRPGGGSLYYDSLSAYGIGTSKEATILAADVSDRGLEYYVRVVDKEGFAYLIPSVEPKKNPISLPVSVTDLLSEWTFYNQTVYNSDNERKSVQKTTLMSIPFETEATTVDSLFEEMLPYDPYEWRLFWWHATQSQSAMDNGTTPVYIEYPVSDANIFKFTPGRAFWLVSKEEKEIHLGGAQTANTQEMVNIQLNPGWNLIANPFNFPVKWADCSNSSAALINYVVSWDEDGYHYDVKRLDPWKGYWVHNPDTLIATLAIPPKAADVSTSVSKELAAEETETLQSGEWNIQFSVGNSTVKDTYNMIGARTTASEERDSFDRLECPPGFGEWLCLSFDHYDWKHYGGAYTADIRPSGQEGYRWIMDIDALTSSDQLDLSWSIENLPSNFEAYLLDPVTQTATNLLAKTERQVPGKASRQLTVLVGTKEYIDENRDGIELTPITFHLAQNYPNPFNPETAIQYSVPQLDRVELVIFNIMGQKISTLKNDSQSPGHYEVIWNGMNDSGVLMASGVYIYRLKIGGKVATKKMLLVR